MIGSLRGQVLDRPIDGRAARRSRRRRLPRRRCRRARWSPRASSGDAVFLHVHTHVREDAIVLYGFATQRRARRVRGAAVGAQGRPGARARRSSATSRRWRCAAPWRPTTSTRCARCPASARRRRRASCSISRTSSALDADPEATLAAVNGDAARRRCAGRRARRAGQPRLRARRDLLRGARPARRRRRRRQRCCASRSRRWRQARDDAARGAARAGGPIRSSAPKR